MASSTEVACASRRTSASSASWLAWLSRHVNVLNFSLVSIMAQLPSSTLGRLRTHFTVMHAEVHAVNALQEFRIRPAKHLRPKGRQLGGIDLLKGLAFVDGQNVVAAATRYQILAVRRHP